MYNIEKPTFNVNEPFHGVTIVQLNQSMIELLIQTLSQDSTRMLPKEVWAFVRALNDPAGCREMRAMRRRKNYLHQPYNNDYDSEDDYMEDDQ